MRSAFSRLTGSRSHAFSLRKFAIGEYYPNLTDATSFIFRATSVRRYELLDVRLHRETSKGWSHRCRTCVPVQCRETPYPL